MLRTYQQPIYDRFKDLSYGGLFLDLGTGKTATTIYMLKYKYETFGQKKIIIFAPASVIGGWKREFEKFWPDCPLYIHLSNEKRIKRTRNLNETLNKDAFILIVNYEVMTSGMKDLILKKDFDILICDESHNLKNHRSKRSKAMFELRKKTRSCFLLTASPILNSLTDIFQQFLIMDKGKTFGPNFYIFQRKYMEDKNQFWAGSPNYFPKWEVRKDLLPEVKTKISSVGAVLKKKDVLKDLPPLISKPYEFELTPEQAKAYKELEKNLVTELKENEFITVENALTKVLRLNQICAGHLGSPDNAKPSVIFKNTKKVDALVDLVEQIVHAEEKVIIWTAFKPEVEMITKALNEAKIYDILYITGDESSAEKTKSEDDFREDAKYKVLIANLASGNAGINLQAASHSINYSRNYSLAHALQSEARNYRSGSEIHKVIMQHNLYIKDSIEEAIIDAVLTKKKLAEDVIDNLDKLKQLDKEFKNQILDKFMKGF